MLNDSPAYKALQEHSDATQNIHLCDLFAADPARFENFHQILDGVLFDYSKHQITADTLNLLYDLARACDVEAKRDQMFAGAKLNSTENRACLHTALRSPVDPALEINGENVADFISDLHTQMRSISDEIRADKNITDVVNIGVGGSDLGPRTVCEILRSQGDGPNIHFLSNVDGHSLEQMLAALKPENTVFLITSKTFTTLETMTNAAYAKNWAGSTQNFVGITAAPEQAAAFGISSGRILPMRDWIGGRFSLWSSVGLPIAVMIGYARFEQLLAGAAAADTHFKTAPLEQNIPALMGMIDIWNRNFKNYNAHCILAYGDCMRFVPDYVQQIVMESNGKAAPYKTAPVVFGQTGTDAQHAFMQAFHQGSDVVPCDFIVSAKQDHSSQIHHIQLVANALAQAEALMMGSENTAEPHKHFDGNRPSTMLILDDLTPYRVGLLMALYEHRVFVQGALWGINSFDQWGVDLGKSLAKDIIAELSDQGDGHTFDSSTAALTAYLKKRL